MESHFGAIDQHRLEYQMPFNDSEFLEYVTGIAVEPCLYHHFYVKWLSFFSAEVSAVPWQAYPGHVPCPVSVPKSLPDQWTAPVSSSYQAALKADLLRRSSVMLSDKAFPRPVLRKSYLRLMRWAWKLNLRNYGYALRAALKYFRYWKTAEGRHELPDFGSPDGAR